MAARIGQHPKLAIVGAGGTVGSQLVELLGQRDFSYAELKLFGAPASAHAKPSLADEPVADIDEFESPEDLAGYDVVFLATPSAPAAAILTASPASVKIDLSAANRLPSTDQSLVAPGLTSRERVIELRSRGNFGIPHPAAQVIAAVLHTLSSETEFVGASVMLGASSAGRDAIATLFNQSAELLNARLDLADDEIQTAFNLFLPDDAEAMSGIIATQVAELIARPVPLVVQVARVPIFHGAAVAIFLSSRADSLQWGLRLREAPGLVLVETGEASASVEAAGQEAVIVKLITNPAGTVLWCVFDAARIAALAAIWVAETVSA
jgi:aspartate-semialdehyde dehydrogenase